MFPTATWTKSKHHATQSCGDEKNFPTSRSHGHTFTQIPFPSSFSNSPFCNAKTHSFWNQMKKLFLLPCHFGFHLLLSTPVTHICPVPSSLNLVTSHWMTRIIARVLHTCLHQLLIFSPVTGDRLLWWFRNCFFHSCCNIFYFSPPIRQSFPCYKSITWLVLHLLTETRNEKYNKWWVDHPFPCVSADMIVCVCVISTCDCRDVRFDCPFK